MKMENVTFIINGKFPEDQSPESISLIREALEQKLRDEIERVTFGRVEIETESDWEFSDEPEEG